MDFSPDEGQQAVADVVTSVLERDNSWDALVAGGVTALGVPVYVVPAGNEKSASSGPAMAASNARMLPRSGASSAQASMEGMSPTRPKRETAP